MYTIVYAVFVVFIYYQIRKEIIMIKKIVVIVIIITTAIAVAEWTLNQIEEGYTPSYPTKLDK